VKAAKFDYRAPTSLDEAVEVLAADPGETSLLAGGQSLVPMLNMRLARPALLIDLNRIPELRGVERRNGTLRIGAMTRQRAVEVDEQAAAVPLLVDAIGHIAHLPIRTRGTVGGSIAHADPAAELPTTVAVLGARMVLRSGRGSRSVSAEEFFVGPLMTSREPDEILEAIEVPVPVSRTGWAFREVARTHGAFALVGVAATVTVAADGSVEAIRLGVLGVGGLPYLPNWLDEVACGAHPTEALFGQIGARVGQGVVSQGSSAQSGLYRSEVAATLTERALQEATRRALEEAGA
jgi:aerobic carbon-monoxide dehydrogenase medium subunit